MTAGTAPRVLIGAAVLLAYPALVHLAVVLRSPMLAAGALAALLLNALGRYLLRGRTWAWLALGGGALAGAGLVYAGDSSWIFYSAPVLVPLALLAVFAASLRAGETPVVTRIARATEPAPLSPAALAYTRGVTELWVAAFAVLALGNALLAVYASVAVWSLFVNGLDYVAVAALFAGEWLVRQHYRRREASRACAAPGWRRADGRG